MVDFDDHFAQGKMVTDNEFSDTDDDNNDLSVDNNTNQSNNNSQTTQQIADLFRQNIKEAKVDLTTMQVCQTTRDRIFPIMKLTTEEMLCDQKL